MSDGDRFEYLLDKIASADIEQEPFKHVHIEEFFEPEDFAAITSANEIAIPPLEDDSALFDTLYDRGFKMVDFPGCITDREEYIAWHSSGKTQRHIHTACEGFGVTLRLQAASTPTLQELIAFLSSDRFNRTVADKFGLSLEKCNVDNGIQKYLDGYEISPHPDIRRKAATFMVNINPHGNSEDLDHHTHYLRLKPRYRHVQKFWQANDKIDRCWVPWDWCDNIKIQPTNNSIVLFAPDNDTMHAVRARYDHLVSQRTQLYGNLWHKHIGDIPSRDWEHFAMDRGELSLGGIKRRVLDALPQTVTAMLRKARRGSVSPEEAKTNEVAERNY